jgi:hypothetical protein
MRDVSPPKDLDDTLSPEAAEAGQEKRAKTSAVLISGGAALKAEVNSAASHSLFAFGSATCALSMPRHGLRSILPRFTGDRTTDVRGSRFLAGRIPGARYVELPGEDHSPAVDSETIVGEISEFLTGARPSFEVDRILATVLFTDIVAQRSGRRVWAIGPGGSCSSGTISSCERSWRVGADGR